MRSEPQKVFEGVWCSSPEYLSNQRFMDSLFLPVVHSRLWGNGLPGHSAPAFAHGCNLGAEGPPPVDEA
eukprot:1766795-Lingulodinium_polyedra.AAC.1